MITTICDTYQSNALEGVDNRAKKERYRPPVSYVIALFDRWQTLAHQINR